MARAARGYCSLGTQAELWWSPVQLNLTEAIREREGPRKGPSSATSASQNHGPAGRSPEQLSADGRATEPATGEISPRLVA